MKNSVILLLLANVALLIWGFQTANETAPVSNHSEPEAPELTEFGNLVLRPDESPMEQQGETIAQCRYMGPLEARELPGRVVSTLDATASEGWVETIREEAPLWWVHLEPAATTGEAEQRLSALQERGIDSFRIDSGEFRNAISLGYFRNRDNATRLAEEYRRREIDAEVRELPQERSLYWYRLPDSSSGEALNGALSASGLAVQERACDWQGGAG